MMPDSGGQVLKVAAGARIRVLLTGVFAAQRAIDVSERLAGEERGESLQPMDRGFRVGNVWNDVLGVDIENVSDRDLLYAARAARRRLFVLSVDVSGKGAVCAVKVANVASSAELATSIEDKPGCGVSDLAGLVMTFFSFPESRWAWLTRHNSLIRLMCANVV